MIRITSLAAPQYLPCFKNLLDNNHIEYIIDKYQKDRIFDIYIVEICNQEAIKRIQLLKKSTETLIYVIGPKDFDLVNECLRQGIQLYFTQEHFKDDFDKYKLDIQEHIQNRFQYYLYKRNGIESRIRLAHISYIESLRHSVIIHSINGEFIERKNLKQVLKDMNSNQFIQIHKSYIINKQYIQMMKGQELVLKNQTVLPIGRAYRAICKS